MWISDYRPYRFWYQYLGPKNDLEKSGWISRPVYKWKCQAVEKPNHKINPIFFSNYLLRPMSRRKRVPSKWEALSRARQNETGRIRGNHPDSIPEVCYQQRLKQFRIFLKGPYEPTNTINGDFELDHLQWYCRVGWLSIYGIYCRYSDPRFNVHLKNLVFNRDWSIN